MSRTVCYYKMPWPVTTRIRIASRPDTASMRESSHLSYTARAIAQLVIPLRISSFMTQPPLLSAVSRKSYSQMPIIDPTADIDIAETSII
jgi:hypothetical protein